MTNALCVNTWGKRFVYSVCTCDSVHEFQLHLKTYFGREILFKEHDWLLISNNPDFSSNDLICH